MAPDIQFIIHCCKSNPGKAAIENIRQFCSQCNNEQWSNLIDRTLFHGVFPTFNQCLLKNAHDLINKDVLTKLKQVRMNTTMQSMMMTGELIQIFSQLKKMGIEALSFKGPALAKIAYGDINQRQFGDLDIFIKKSDFRKAIPIMNAKAYQASFPLEKFTGDKVMFEMNNDCGFYKQSKSMLVEFHWDFFRKLAISTDKFAPWEDTETIVIDQFEIKTLKPETHLLYHSLHGSKHVWERLFWILDLDRFIRAHDKLDWDELLAKSSSIGAQKMFLLGIALAIKYFDTPVPTTIAQHCQAARFENVITYVENEFSQIIPTPEDSLTKLSKVIALRDNLYYKAATILEFIFRPGINERRTIILPDKLFWLYWLIRPLGMGFRFLFCRLLHLCDTHQH